MMDYYGFPPSLYQLKFKSRGDHELSQRVLDLFKKVGVIIETPVLRTVLTCCSQAGQLARLSPRTEARGMDGRGFSGPGLDHGVFIPFRLMFGEEYTDVPIVEVSMDGSLDPEKEWKLGQAVNALR